MRTADVARTSRPLSRERPARANSEGRMPSPQRAGRPRYVLARRFMLY
jgi:hypothetical protein